MPKEKSHKTKTQSLTMVLSLLFGVGYAALTMVTLLFLFPLFLRSNSNPDKMIPAFTLVIALVSGIVCGIVSAKKHGQSGALTGLLSGMLMTLLLFILSLFFKSAEVTSTVSFKMLLVSMIIFPSIISGKSCLKKRSVHKHP